MIETLEPFVTLIVGLYIGIIAGMAIATCQDRKREIENLEYEYIVNARGKVIRRKKGFFKEIQDKANKKVQDKAKNVRK